MAWQTDHQTAVISLKTPRVNVCQSQRSVNENIVDLGFPSGTSGKEPVCQCRRQKRCGFDPWVRKMPWRRAWQPTPVFWPEEVHGQGSLAGYSPEC